MPDDWFRRTDWTAEVEADFFARLGRARRTSRAQYLRIQALHLQEAGGQARLRKALELLDRLIGEYPEPLELAGAHQARAWCLVALGDTDGALTSLRAALGAQRQRPNVQTGAHLDLGMLAVRLRRTDLYDEAMAALGEFGVDELLPQQRYEAAAIRAAILGDRGALQEAGTYARQGLEAAARTHSGLRYHPRVGLVTIRDPALHARLQRLARGG